MSSIISSDDKARKDRARNFDNLGRVSTIVKTYAYWRIDEEELYKELGFESTAEYAKHKDGFSKGYLSKLLKIARCFFPYLKIKEQDSLEVSSSFMHETFTMPIMDLYKLTRLSEKQRHNLIVEGEAKIRGKVFTADQLSNMPSSYIDAIFEGKKRALLKPEVDPDNLPFDLVYERTAKRINAILYDLHRCPFFDHIEVENIEKLIRGIMSFYEKKDEIIEQLNETQN